MDRRRLIMSGSVLLGGPLLYVPVAAAIDESPEWGETGAAERNDWVASVMGTKSFDAPGVLSKFSDDMFYLRAPLPWKPNDATSQLAPVTVPAGFVTDLASIPRPFWSLMPRDGSYADAAIVHDYLYWTQTGNRLTADQTFRSAMQDLEVHPGIVSIIFLGVRSWFGQRAWDENARQRKEGESRILLKYPATSATKWADWKMQDGNVGKGS